MALKGDQPQTPVLRENYQAPVWLIDSIDMTIVLDAEQTRVAAILKARRNPQLERAETDAALLLHGVGLETRRVEVNGRRLDEKEYRVQGETLTIADVPDRARIVTEVMIHPVENTALEGLYVSGSSLLTQCEAEGFRKITWFPDRPDVMSRYRVRLEADRARYPVLLGNGNLIDSGLLDGNRHYAVWDDPFPKPSYLFAIVAGELGLLEDSFTTVSGRQVALKIYSEHQNLGQLDHAMASLKNSMAWDEQRYGLEYDLDVYHIVATHDFNMGAMENKSLNIFNARYVLADPATATDFDYAGIEGVIAHEYFHNWTGNRVTCRDWFQLTLKEGLTVFRDQEFSADMQSVAVTRIQNVDRLMNHQFPEDAGPMAHPIRPQRYVEINNFYTATVYEKGAEIIRMYQTLLGRDGFRRGMDLYFERHDGQAVTCDDFLAAMADANAADLQQFSRWYDQVGTPKLKVTADWIEAEGALELTFEQALIDHPDNTDLGPLLLPVRMGFIDAQGQRLNARHESDVEACEEHLIQLTEHRQTVRFNGFDSRPVVSLLRDYSAPVALEFDWSETELALLLAHDADPVARWLAGKRLAAGVLDRAIAAYRNAEQIEAPEGLIQAWKIVLDQAEKEPSLAAELLQLPSESELALRNRPIDVSAIHHARESIARHLVDALSAELSDCYRRFSARADWRFTVEQVGRRRLANTCLGWLVVGNSVDADRQAVAQDQSADNLTDRFAALSALVRADSSLAEAGLAAFAERYRDNPLVMDKWFALQAMRPVEASVEHVKGLMQHPAFSLKNPNKVRALIGSFAMHNPIAFHRSDGAGYALMVEVLRELDTLNPQVAARLVAVFNRWSDFAEPQKNLMADALKHVLALPGLSNDVAEIAGAALARTG